ncbi:MAG: LamG domain-containing protein, partial [Pseudomonadota bacterium]|nr:LamG domain-containing protein [Pseudomonadota bacterium]
LLRPRRPRRQAHLPTQPFIGTWTRAPGYRQPILRGMAGQAPAVTTNGNFSIVSPSNTTTNTYIGYRQSGGEYFSGDIDDVRIYNRSLSSPEVQSIYTYGQP